MPGGRPWVLTAHQIEQATLLRRTLGLSIAAIAEELKVNRETLREAFVRNGVKPLPQPQPPKSDDPPAVPVFEPAAPPDDGGFLPPASTTDAPSRTHAPAAPPPSLEEIRKAWVAGCVDDLRNGWATDLAVNPYRGDW